jgi:hypothetical protein
MHLGSPSADISLDLWRDVNKIGCGQAVLSGFIVDLFCIRTVRYQVIAIKCDPLAQVFVAVCVNPGTFTLVSFVSGLGVAIRARLIKSVSEPTLLVRGELPRRFKYLL